MTNTITMYLGDVRDGMATHEDNSADLLVTSPPFLALRSYLPADHPDKHREIGSEPTPAAFIETMLGLTADWRRIITDTGSIAVEIGDTYSGSGGAGGDYLPGGWRDGQPGFGGSAEKQREGNAAHWRQKARCRDEWPLPKSLTFIPTLYGASLAYGRNLLTGTDSPAGQWRVRNLLTWTRPNPPVGALGDKFRPATSFVTVACTSQRRWFDLDAVRQPNKRDYDREVPGGQTEFNRRLGVEYNRTIRADPSGAPPLDWWDANDCDELDDWQPFHRLPTAPYRGSHYATFNVALPKRLIEAMCPREVCRECGEPRRRIVDVSYVDARGRPAAGGTWSSGVANGQGAHTLKTETRTTTTTTTIGWTDCGHDAYRPGRTLDPFGGSGTTAIAAARTGRDAVLIDLDGRNIELVRERITSSLRVVSERREGDTITWTVEPPLPAQRDVDPGQMSVFDLDGGAA